MDNSLGVRALGPIGHLPVDEGAARDAQPPTFSALGGVSIDIDAITLARGSHGTPDEGMCLMEAVAYVAGEPHSDHPKCVCPVLAAFGRAWNDGLPDEDRNRLLKPFIPRLIGTRSTVEVQERRAYMPTDWAVRVATPVWLRAAGLDGEAGSLEALHPLTSAEACRDAMPTIRQAREAVLAAAEAAAVYAARAAARTAAVYAAWDAASAAVTDAATAAVGATAGAAAGATAGAAAVVAARSVLRPHVERLQASAVDLYERMIEVAP